MLSKTRVPGPASRAPEPCPAYASTRIPAARAACTPYTLSSTTTHRSGGTPMVLGGQEEHVGRRLSARDVLRAEDPPVEAVEQAGERERPRIRAWRLFDATHHGRASASRARAIPGTGSSSLRKASAYQGAVRRVPAGRQRPPEQAPRPASRTPPRTRRRTARRSRRWRRPSRGRPAPAALTPALTRLAVDQHAVAVEDDEFGAAHPPQPGDIYLPMPSARPRTKNRCAHEEEHDHRQCGASVMPAKTIG